MYVIVEGIDGAGKTTLVRELAERLRVPELFGRHPEDPVLQPRLHVRNEPSSDGAGYIARDYFKRTVQNPGAYHPLVAAGLMIADRVAGTTEYRSWIDNPRWLLLSDRGFLSTLAYQGMELTDRKQSRRPLYDSAFDTLLDAHAGIPLPDLILFLSCDPEVAAARALRRRVGEHEHLNRAYINRVDASYTAALVFLRERLGQAWIDEHFAIIPTSRPGGERETNVSIPTSETVDHAFELVRRKVAQVRLAALDAAGG